MMTGAKRLIYDYAGNHVEEADLLEKAVQENRMKCNPFLINSSTGK
jgi:hypothetical protein